MILIPTKNYQIGILTTFVFMLLAFLLSGSFMDIFWGFGVITVGILHGANDLEILSKKFKGGENKLAMYRYNFLFYTIYGALIFFLIFTLQCDEVVVVIDRISGYTLTYELFLYPCIGLGITLIIWILFVKQLRIFFINECLLLLLLGGLFSVGSLLFAFAFYFVVWHSLPSLKEQLIYLHGDFNLKSFFKYFKSSFIYWIAALVSLFLVYRYVDFKADYFMPLFFSFLAAITFPHTIVIGMMKYKNA